MRMLNKSSMIGVMILVFMLLVTAVYTIPSVNGQQEKLVVLMSTPSKYADPYIERFEEWYHIRTGKTIAVEHVQLGGVNSLARVEEQERAPYEDVVANLGYAEFERLKKGGFLIPYLSPNWEYIPDNVGNLVGKDPEGYYVGFGLTVSGIMVNTEVLERENLASPTGYRDIALDTEYYGHIVMESPLSTSVALGNTEAILTSYGWVQGWNISIQLTSLIDRFFISEGVATALTAEGEYAAVITRNTDWNEYVEAGYPVKWVWPEEGTVAHILYAGVLRGAGHRENALLWIDWMLSDEGQRAWADIRHETVLRSDIELPEGVPTLVELDLDNILAPNYDIEVAKQQYPAVSRIWSEKLIGYHSMIQGNYLQKEILDGYLESWILRSMQRTEDALLRAQNTLAVTKAIELTEAGQALLDQAELHLSMAETAFRVEYDQQKAVELADEASRFAQMAAGYVPQPPVWPYYLGMLVVAVIAGSVSGKLGYDYFKKRYQLSMREIFLNLKDKLEVDDAGRLLLVSDVMRVPMILTTRDHISQIQMTCERVLGKEKMMEVMYQSGFETGYDFSTAIAGMSELEGVQILEDYLRIASVRGWGRFTVVKADVDAGEFIIQTHSSIVEEFPPGSGKVCHIWRGIFAGVVQTVLESLDKTGTLESEETRCMADGDPYCEIRVNVEY